MSTVCLFFSSNPRLLYRPLKAFINAHKPRISRKDGRQKKNQKVTSQGNTHTSDAFATDADTDVVQESDSQTSDNQTERPQEVSSTNETSTYVPENILTSDSMDPHFARLLNSLTLSATGNVPQTLNSAHFPPAVPTTPIPNSVHSIDPDPISDRKQQSHQKEKVETHKAKIPVVTLQDLARDSSGTPVVAADDNNSFSPSRIPTHSHDTLYSPRQTRNSNAPDPATSTVSHRPIRTDISPYLTKSSADVSTTRRLQQLALLERVADESAKMLPQIRGAAALAPASSIPSTHPSPHTSVFPHGFPGVFYSTPPRQLPSNTVQIPYNLSRSHPSQAIRGGASQTLNSQIINHFQPAPSNFSFERPASNFGARPQSYDHDYNSTSPLPALSEAISQSRDNFPHEVGLPDLNRFASATPAANSFPSRGTSASTAQTLLSILNGNQISQGNPVVPPPADQPI